MLILVSLPPPPPLSAPLTPPLWAWAGSRECLSWGEQIAGCSQGVTSHCTLRACCSEPRWRFRRQDAVGQSIVDHWKPVSACLAPGDVHFTSDASPPLPFSSLLDSALDLGKWGPDRATSSRESTEAQPEDHVGTFVGPSCQASPVCLAIVKLGESSHSIPADESSQRLRE